MQNAFFLKKIMFRESKCPSGSLLLPFRILNKNSKIHRKTAFLSYSQSINGKYNSPLIEVRGQNINKYE